MLRTRRRRAEQSDPAAAPRAAEAQALLHPPMTLRSWPRHTEISSRRSGPRDAYSALTCESRRSGPRDAYSALTCESRRP
jgi:hypothetical protein